MAAVGSLSAWNSGWFWGLLHSGAVRNDLYCFRTVKVIASRLLGGEAIPKSLEIRSPTG